MRESSSKKSETKPGLGRHTLTISQRGEALGERPPSSVKTSTRAVKVEPSETVEGTSQKLEEQAVALVKQESAGGGGAGFRPKLRPFARDEAKQLRYEQYLVLRRNRRTGRLTEVHLQ